MTKEEHVDFSTAEYYERLTPEDIWRSLKTHREIMKNILKRLEVIETRMARLEASI